MSDNIIEAISFVMSSINYWKFYSHKFIVKRERVSTKMMSEFKQPIEKETLVKWKEKVGVLITYMKSDYQFVRWSNNVLVDFQEVL